MTDSTMQLYMEQISAIPMLSKEEEFLLARKCADGDQEAIRHMVAANLRLVVAIAKGYSDSGVPLLDLIQGGSLGLLYAAKGFDPSLGFRFSTYATKWIRSGVLKCIEENGRLIQVSQRIAEKMRKIQRARAALEEPTVEAIAEACDMDVAQVEEVLSVPEVCSLNDDETLQYVQTLEAQPQEDFVRRELRAALEGLLKKLSDRSAMVVRLHFGLEDGQCHTQREIAATLGVSKERVRQIIDDALAKLQRISAGLGLEDFLES